MPEKKSKLKTPLTARKQLLVLESEFNRVQMIAAVKDWKKEFHHSKEQFNHFSSILSMAGSVATVVPYITRMFSKHPAEAKKPGISSLLLNGMTTGTSLWNIVRAFLRK